MTRTLSLTTLLLLTLIARTSAASDGQFYAETSLAISYLIQFWQTPSYELAVYFRGAARSGALLAFAGTFLRPQVLEQLPDFWALVLS